MDPLLFRNIAGRSGRAGWHTEGVTVVYDNTVGTPSMVAPQARRNLQRQVFASDELPPLKSVFASQDNDRENEATVAVVASNLMAAVPENPEAEDLASVLYRHSFAATNAPGETLSSALDESRSELLLDSPQGPFAVAASPIQLTQLGSAANATGLSPVACRAILTMLDSTDFIGMTPESVGAEVLRQMASVPEQTNGKLTKRLAGSKNHYAVEGEDLEPLLASWMAGLDEVELFRQLGLVRRSKRKPPLDAWLAGEAESPTWPDVFDQFIDFRSITLTGFLPWVLRACSSLAVLVDAEGMGQVAWSRLADFVETGTSNERAAAALRAGSPGGRMLAILVGERFVELDLAEDDPLGLRICRDSPTTVTALFAQVVGALDEDVLGDDAALMNWLFDQADRF